MAKGDISKVSELVRVFADQIQQLETASNEVKMLRLFAYAENKELDGIGEIVGENRQGKSDADYRLALLARINMNASRGEPERIITALRAITGTNLITYTEDYPAGINLQFAYDEDIVGLYSYVQSACPGGVRLYLSKFDMDTPFRFDIGPNGFDSGNLGTLLL